MQTTHPIQTRNRLADFEDRATDFCASPGRLVRQSLRSAERQLVEAREDLKAARRRVVELERVVKEWNDLASEIERNAGGDWTGAPNRFASAN